MVSSEEKSGSYNWQKKTGSHEQGSLNRKTNHTNDIFSWRNQ